MAERPIFVPAPDTSELVKEILCQIVWNPGFAPVQKKKNIRALHAAAAAKGYSPVLEISTKSDSPLGQHLSAFNLKVDSWQFGKIPLELAYQGSKVFEHGGPFQDLYGMENVREARRDPRLQKSGKLIGFRFEEQPFLAEPKTAFYDWLYINALAPHAEWLQQNGLNRYKGFTDIEFNPQRSLNCQARSFALLMTLMAKSVLDDAVKSPETFVEMISRSSYGPREALAEK
jgi:Family of unknown function (DUF6977)